MHSNSLMHFPLKPRKQQLKLLKTNTIYEKFYSRVQESWYITLVQSELQ